ncbi:Homeobox-DDT domain protein rlt1 [Sarracenia purpurea var. burkii]
MNAMIIILMAYGWGFDIRSWQHHLNPLTWAEILRQFALSAGFGPQLKKRNVEQAYLRDENEVGFLSFHSLFFEKSIALV